MYRYPKYLSPGVIHVFTKLWCLVSIVIVTGGICIPCDLIKCSCLDALWKEWEAEALQGYFTKLKDSTRHRLISEPPSLWTCPALYPSPASGRILLTFMYLAFLPGLFWPWLCKNVFIQWLEPRCLISWRSTLTTQLLGLKQELFHVFLIDEGRSEPEPPLYWYVKEHLWNKVVSLLLLANVKEKRKIQENLWPVGRSQGQTSGEHSWSCSFRAAAPSD